MSGNWRFLERFLQNRAARLLHHGSCAHIPVVSLFFFCIPCFSLSDGLEKEYEADTGGTGGRIWRMGIGTDTGTEGGHGEYIRYSSVIPCFSGCTRYPLPLSLPLPLCIPLWFPSSFFLFPPVVFLSLVILLLPCIPCLSPASSHPPIHSLIRLHGYPFAITDNRLTDPPHTPRYAITRIWESASADNPGFAANPPPERLWRAQRVLSLLCTQKKHTAFREKEWLRRKQKRGKERGVFF